MNIRFYPFSVSQFTPTELYRMGFDREKFLKVNKVDRFLTFSRSSKRFILLYGS
ncbi:hypothetical protein ABH962_004512 [Bacillus sp. RC54]